MSKARFNYFLVACVYGMVLGNYVSKIIKHQDVALHIVFIAVVLFAYIWNLIYGRVSR